MATIIGNIVVENIKKNDIHYEFGYEFGIKCKVLTLPIRSDDGKWTWKSENLNTGEIINYTITEGFENYCPKLYDYQAYIVNKWL